MNVSSIISNSTGNLTNLRANENYAVTIQMCTRVGCGPVSQAFYIPSITGKLIVSAEKTVISVVMRSCDSTAYLC